MEVSTEGRELIKQFEGLSLTAYRCPAGVPTIGYGRTQGVQMGDTTHHARIHRSADLLHITLNGSRWRGRAVPSVGPTLRWHVQLGCSVIPRSTRAAGLAENRDLFDFALTAEEMAAIATLEAGERTGPDPELFS